MASKTVWIVGGLVVALGVVAYLSYHTAPAGKDAAGTIVEAKRARADGTNTFNPAPTSSTTDDRGDIRADDRAGADRAGADRAGADRAGADRAGADRAGADTAAH